MVGPGYRNKMLAVKSRKNAQKIVNLNEIIFLYGPPKWAVMSIGQRVQQDIIMLN